MASQRVFGVLILIAGIVLLFVGMNASHSMADSISDTFTGRFTNGTTWYIIGGIATGLLGVGLMLSDYIGKKA